jgi:hypothetical protein
VIFLLLPANNEIQDSSEMENVAKPMADEIMSIARQFSSLPELDSRRIR